MKRTALLIVAVLMAGWIQAGVMAAVQASDVKVDEIVFGTGVTDRQIQGKNTEFSGADIVNCLTVISAKTTPTTIKHVWYKNGTKLGVVSLDIGGSGWRTWSNHSVQPGAWKVEVQDMSGTVISMAEFTVK